MPPWSVALFKFCKFAAHFALTSSNAHRQRIFQITQRTKTEALKNSILSTSSRSVGEPLHGYQFVGRRRWRLISLVRTCRHIFVFVNDRPSFGHNRCMLVHNTRTALRWQCSVLTRPEKTVTLNLSCFRWFGVWFFLGRLPPAPLHTKASYIITGACQVASISSVVLKFSEKNSGSKRIWYPCKVGLP